MARVTLPGNGPDVAQSVGGYASFLAALLGFLHQQGMEAGGGRFTLWGDEARGEEHLIGTLALTLRDKPE